MQKFNSKKEAIGTSLGQYDEVLPANSYDEADTLASELNTVNEEANVIKVNGKYKVGLRSRT